ncbi:MAG TPA: electron transfer flavoprotein subunit alpha/FixB family protein [Acidimicrobiia bacterium]|nr:electron transfer flavoprotein subunit alpha/FixB family protein [Acidimicrobiia bacterium]
MSVLVLIDHDKGEVTEVARQAVTLGRSLADDLGTALSAVVIGEGGKVVQVGSVIDLLWRAGHPLLTDYAPGGWGETLVQLVAQEMPAAVVAPGTDRGNEVLAHLAALADLPMAANVAEVDTAEDVWHVVRLRWGGSLLEHAELSAAVRLLSAAPYAFPPASVEGEPPTVKEFEPSLDESHAVTRVVDRTTVDEGITLATAPLVVSGGRGVGGPDGFGPLEELAGLLGGAVGCSRVVTNNGWRPHSDQVGQTGTRVAPDVYIACGISGAIQHWVGMMASKNVIAINTDPEAPMVTKADYALIGDVGEVVPTLVDEIRRRRS